MRPLTLLDFVRLAAGDAAVDVGLDDALATLRDPEQWVSAEVLAMFRAWRRLIVRRDEMNDAANALREFGAMAAGETLTASAMRLFGGITGANGDGDALLSPTADLAKESAKAAGWWDEFSRVLMERARDERFNPLALPGVEQAQGRALVARLHETHGATNWEALGRFERATLMRDEVARVADAASAYATYVGAGQGSWWKVPDEAETERATTRVLTLSNMLAESNRRLEEVRAETAAQERAVVEENARRLAREAAEAEAERDRVIRRSTDAAAAARIAADRAAAFARMQDV